ncbi:hypothetical protein COO91_00615 [Nostoc flagelliforme CCNUN1]|uniref:Uncharacterized protein n=1 Tax=Nostoc flagelliforme CCNUN1 TaxID=2038116 RepID=A0A2K8SH38_9NOSO|nr:hypothetical protein COO91_00615 [Nostoc flagelliforme CCNUN1]
MSKERFFGVLLIFTTVLVFSAWVTVHHVYLLKMIHSIYLKVLERF